MFVAPAAPDRALTVLFVHGWAQSAWCWRRQLDHPGLRSRYRLAAFDLRGHGDSDRPAGGYHDPAAMAGDLRAVLDTLGGGPVLLVGWSYGGLVIADYLDRHGTTGVAGIVLVGAITGIGRGQPAGRVGPAMLAALPAALHPDPAVAGPALTAFVGELTAAPLPAAETARLLDVAFGTPAAARAGLFDRIADGAGLVRALTERPVPVLVLHGRADRVVDPAAAEHHLATIPGAVAEWWDDTGHLPFAEDAERFAATLTGFAEQC